MRPSEADVNARSSGRCMSGQWIEETHQVLREVVLGLERVGCEGGSVRKVRHRCNRGNVCLNRRGAYYLCCPRVRSPVRST